MFMINHSQLKAITNDLKLLFLSRSGTEERFAALSKIFYQLVKAATNDELNTFISSYARLKYLLVKGPFSDSEKNSIDAFGRFIRRGYLRGRTQPETILQGILLLKKILISKLSENNLSFDWIDERQYIDNYFVSLAPPQKALDFKKIRVLCLEWSQILHDQNGKKYFILKCSSLDEDSSLLEEISIVIWEYKNYQIPKLSFDLTYIHSLLEKNMILYVENMTQVKEKLYQVSPPSSFITIQPDFLVNTTEISECFNNNSSNSDIFFLSKLIDELPGSAALKGSIVGYYLDELIREGHNPQDVFEIFEKAQRENALKAACLGTRAMQEMKKSIEDEHHLQHISELARKQKNKPAWVEPTYFSKEYGLQGRLDLLVTDQNSSKEIIELKSGKSPDCNVWKNHKMQVVAYNMMLETTYDNYQGSSAIFYSKSPPSRQIISEEKEKQDVLKIRNEIVSKIYQLAYRDFTILDHIKNNGIIGIPPFSIAKLELFKEHYDPTRITTQYYRELVAFILRELISAKVGDDNFNQNREENFNYGFSSLWLDKFDRKSKNGKIISNLTVIDIKKNEGYIAFKFNTKINDKTISHSFREKDLVIIYVQDDNPLKKRPIFKASIKELSIDKLTISLFNKQTDYSFFESDKSWVLEPDIYERNYWNSIAILFKVLTCSKKKKELLLGHARPQFTGSYQLDPELTYELGNVSQLIEQALKAQDYYLLQGPPGTGKTSTFLPNYIRESIKIASHKKIFILAFTNKAVEGICKSFNDPRFGEKIQYIRLGSKDTVDKNLFTEKLNGNNPDVWKQTLQSYQIFISTISTFKNHYLPLQELINFDELIVDEASQLTEADLAGILVLFNKFILIGDHKQLPSVITQNEENCKIRVPSFTTYNINVKDFQISLFERLIKNAEEKNWQDCFGQLTKHYRMHDDIAELIKSHYKKPLESSKPSQQAVSPPYLLPNNHILNPISHSRIIFIDVPSPRDKGVMKCSKWEAAMVAIIVKVLLNQTNLKIEVAQNKSKASNIGIITPFRQQISMIKEALINQQQENLLSEIVIDTVERYQGDERKIIIFSTTIGSAYHIKNIQSLDSLEETDRKLLVSISRAEEQLIILGNLKALNKSEHYSKIISQIESKNGLFTRDFSTQVLKQFDVMANSHTRF